MAKAKAINSTVSDLSEQPAQTLQPSTSEHTRSPEMKREAATERPNINSVAELVAAHPDPVVRIAAQLKQVKERYNELDEEKSKEKKDVPGFCYRDSEMEDLYDREECLRGSLGTQQATSLEGAMAQLNELALIIDGDFHNGPDKQERRKHKMRVDRLIYSIASVLAPLSSPKVLDALPIPERRLNPWLPYEEQWAAVEEKRSA